MEERKYKVDERVGVQGWARKSIGTVVDVKWIYHHRLQEHCWGYKCEYEDDGPGLTMTYVPEGYLRKIEKPTTKLVYIGSPYSHPDDSVRHGNFELVSKLAGKLVSEGHVAFSPITYGHTLLTFAEMPTNWQFWKNLCLAFLAHADELLVYQMPGWENSGGLAAEIEFAKEHKIPITYLEYTPWTSTQNQEQS